MADNIPPHFLTQLAGLLAPLLAGANGSLGNTLPEAPAQNSNNSATQPSATHQRSQPPAITAQASRPSSVLPAINLYQSSRLPQTPIPPAAAFPPLPAISSQRPFSADTRNANAQRMASAAANLPPRTALAIRTARIPTSGSGVSRRARGPAGHPPSLTQTSDIDQTMSENLVTGVRQIRLRCKVYPQRSGEHIVYLRQRDSFNLELSHNHLLHDLELPINTTIRQLLTNLTDLLANSPFQYRFDSDEDDFLLPHESIPLTLMRVSNRARRRPSTDQIYLAEHPVASDTATLENLVLSDPVRFMFSNISFEDRRLVLFFSVQGETFTALLPGDGNGQARRHSCIPQRLWSKFPDDTRRRRSRPSEPEETSGGETDTQEDAATVSAGNTSSDSENEFPEFITRSVPLRPRQPPRNAGAVPASANPPNQPSRAPVSNVLARTETLTSLGASLWSSPWSPPPLSTLREPLDMRSLDQEVFDLATIGRDLQVTFVLRGTSTVDLAQKLLTCIGEAVDRNDFSKILAPNRHFIVSRPTRPGALPQANPPPLSVGEGIEKEVVYLAFQNFKGREAEFFQPRAGGHSTITVTSRYASAARLRSLSILGAVTALLLIYGIPPEPLSPALMQYLLHSCNLQALHPGFLREWLPEVHQTISAWIATSPNEEDLSQFASHFAVFHDIQVASLKGRDETSHQAIAAEMLHRAVIGPEPSTHPEIQAFYKGFLLNCPRSGFTMTKLVTTIEGGSDALLNMIWTGQIKSYDDLSTHLRFPAHPAGVFSMVSPALSRHNIASFKDLFENFLKGSGIPHPHQFSEAKEHFSTLIDLNELDEPSFRPKYFTWAASGGPSLDIAGEGIQVILCGEGDLGYANSPLQRAMITEGKVCFRTCIREVRVPAPYLVNLADAADDAASFQKSVDHWLLCEVLNAIAGHSIL